MSFLALFFISICLICTGTAGADSMSKPDRVASLKQATLKLLKNSFEEEQVPADFNLRPLEIATEASTQGYLHSTFYSTSDCEEDTDQDFIGLRLNTCIHELADPGDKEQGFVIYTRLVNNQVVGYHQSYSDAACTKKRGYPRKWKTPVGVCLPDGTRYEINAGLDKVNQNIGVGSAIFKTKSGCRAFNTAGVLVYQGFPFNRCQSNFNDFKYTSCSSDVAGYLSFYSSDGTCICPQDDYENCTDEGTPGTLDMLGCTAIESGSWLKDICI